MGLRSWLGLAPAPPRHWPTDADSHLLSTYETADPVVHYADAWLTPLGSGTRVPLITVHRGPEECIIHAHLPGFTKRDVLVDVFDGTLTISGERTAAAPRAPWWRRPAAARRFGSFTRSMPLPDGVTLRDLSISMAGEELHLVIPNRTAANIVGHE